MTTTHQLRALHKVRGEFGGHYAGRNGVYADALREP
jgi:hypothetical protein